MVWGEIYPVKPFCLLFLRDLLLPLLHRGAKKIKIVYSSLIQNETLKTQNCLPPRALKCPFPFKRLYVLFSGLNFTSILTWSEIRVNLVEDFNNNGVEKMATVNFSVPDEVKTLFNSVFAGRNKSAVIADLMMRAVEEDQKHERRVRAIHRLIAGRHTKRVVTTEEIYKARKALRS